MSDNMQRSHTRHTANSFHFWTNLYRTAATARAIKSHQSGGARRDRTDDLLLAKQALSQLSYGPFRCQECSLTLPYTNLPCGAIYASAACLVMVGLGGLEPPTSRLSSARSNQLSYKPDSDDRDADGQGQHPCRLSSVVRNLSSEKARPRRKRNVDGGVPPIRDQTSGCPKTPPSYPVMFLSAGNERNMTARSWFRLLTSWHP
jgi:hypothetical protein